jgi:hypothetical protein
MDHDLIRWERNIEKERKEEWRKMRASLSLPIYPPPTSNLEPGRIALPCPACLACRLLLCVLY